MTGFHRNNGDQLAENTDCKILFRRERTRAFWHAIPFRTPLPATVTLHKVATFDSAIHAVT